MKRGNSIYAGAGVGVLAPLIAAGAGFYIGQITFALIMLGIAAAMLLISYVAIIRPAQVRNDLMIRGRDAEGKIVEVRDTRGSMNRNPIVELVIEVAMPGRAPYRTEITTAISRLQVGQYVPGAQVGLRVDPDKPDRIAIVRVGPPLSEGTGELTGMDPAYAEQMLRENQDRNDAILAIGAPARALIIEAKSLNIMINGNNPAMEFKLKVLAQPPFEAMTKAIISEASVSKYAAGQEVAVKYDPHDLARVSIDPDG